MSIAAVPEDTAEDPALATALARFAAPHAARCAGLVLTGGDTARALLEALDIPWLRIVGEVEPGVPLCVAGPLTRPIVTKAGAFGDADTLRRCRARMKETRVNKPRIAITMGDAAGVGPEVIAKSLAHAGGVRVLPAPRGR